jgi:tetratricopeptide (TPR) repeat protein
MLTGILIAITGILVVLSARSITTLLHELGHAIPALIYTQGEVTVYVGSYGDISNSLRVNLGRLKLYLKFNILDWKLGLCTHQGPAYYIHLFVIILGGPLISLVISIVLLYCLFQEGISDEIKVGMGLFLLSSVWDFMVNIVPLNVPLKLHDGGTTHNDGYQLKRLLSLGEDVAKYDEAIHLFHEQTSEQSIPILEELLAKKPANRIIAHSLIEILIAEQQYADAISVFQTYHTNHKIKSHEYELLGDIYRGLKDWKPSLEAYNHYLYTHFEDFHVINKKIGVLLELGATEQAKEETKISLRLSPENNFEALLYSGIIAIRQKDYSHAKRYLDKALAYNDQSAEVQLQLAFYFEAQGQYVQAKTHYMNAKTLGTTYHGIDFKISELARYTAL